ncbi:MAG: hypothetical protein LBP96_01875 [Bacteroidales bacterium]|jgi:hypothetical protein|nr:hypothetical protein [Bacteroidales bacterium]
MPTKPTTKRTTQRRKNNIFGVFKDRTHVELVPDPFGTKSKSILHDDETMKRLKAAAAERKRKYTGKLIELVPDPFNTGYDAMKARKEKEAKRKKALAAK